LIISTGDGIISMIPQAPTTTNDNIHKDWLSFLGFHHHIPFKSYCPEALAKNAFKEGMHGSFLWKCIPYETFRGYKKKRLCFILSLVFNCHGGKAMQRIYVLGDCKLSKYPFLALG
jgi:hypothetical protein